MLLTFVNNVRGAFTLSNFDNLITNITSVLFLNKQQFVYTCPMYSNCRFVVAIFHTSPSYIFQLDVLLFLFCLKILFTKTIMQSIDFT